MSLLRCGCLGAPACALAAPPPENSAQAMDSGAAAAPVVALLIDAYVRIVVGTIRKAR